MSHDQSFFLVTFRDPEELKDVKAVTVKVKTIKDSQLGLSFVALSDFIFEEPGPVIDPNTEKLRKRFEKTKSLHLSIYNIISIEEIGMEHVGLRFVKDKSNLVVFPNNPQ